MRKRSASRRKLRKNWKERRRSGRRGRSARRRRRRSVYANGRSVGRGSFRPRRSAITRNAAWIKVSALNRGRSRIFGSILLRTDRSKKYIWPSSKINFYSLPVNKRTRIVEKRHLFDICSFKTHLITKDHLFVKIKITRYIIARMKLYRNSSICLIIIDRSFVENLKMCTNDKG